ncbi:hypothetical protein ACQEVC_43960 [Plantactinospora sp. CA-294935]
MSHSSTPYPTPATSTTLNGPPGPAAAFGDVAPYRNLTTHVYRYC